MSKAADNNTPRIQGAGQIIQQLRHEAQMSLGDLSAKLGWAKGRLSKYESNQLGLSTAVIDEIARALGKQPAQVALMCLQERYPSLKSSKTGALLQKAMKELE